MAELRDLRLRRAVLHLQRFELSLCHFELRLRRLELGGDAREQQVTRIHGRLHHAQCDGHVVNQRRRQGTHEGLLLSVPRGERRHRRVEQCGVGQRGLGERRHGQHLITLARSRRAYLSPDSPTKIGERP